MNPLIESNPPQSSGLTWLFFALLTVGSWGLYGAFLHDGQAAMNDPVNGRYKAFLCVGIAYFLVGVIVPSATLWLQGKLAGFTGRGVAFSTAGGMLGALGAACIIWAFQNGGKPLYVMPLVFAGAPVVNALLTLATHPGEAKGVSPFLFVGIALSAVGTWMVLRFLPA